MPDIDELLSQVLVHESTEELQLLDKVLSSGYPSNKGVEIVWDEESEERINAYEKGNLPAVNELDVFKKYKR
ncbi:MAG: hypothetical protein COA92_09385 [Sulfurovum sp.]|nr:MAG: hypothetical protein COA92_09385 [Sulfurovum sp.]